jgi:hypothetical protein
MVFSVKEAQGFRLKGIRLKGIRLKGIRLKNKDLQSSAFSLQPTAFSLI